MDLGIRLTQEGRQWVATCKRLGIQSEAASETEAIKKCRDQMVLCLRRALQELENETSEDENARLCIDATDDEVEYDEERDFEVPLPEPSLSKRQQETADRILKAAKRYKDTFSGSAVAEKIGGTFAHVNGVLSVLVTMGVLQRVKRGQYRMVKDES